MSGPLSRRVLLGAALLCGANVTACGSNSGNAGGGSSTTPTTASAGSDVRSVAADAYVFGYPLVLMDVTRVTSMPANTFEHADTLPGPADRQVVRPNLDTLYSQSWLDVRHEPVILRVPVMDGTRYWIMQFLDAWSNTFANPSSVRPQLTSGRGRGPFTYAITGPGWSGRLPDGVTPFAAPTGTVWLIGRIELEGRDDLSTVQDLRQQLRLAPLSKWTNGAYAAQPDQSGRGNMKASPRDEVADMDGRTFFNRMCALLAANPAAPADAAAMRRFATIGIVPGGNVDKLSPADLSAALAHGKDRIATYVDGRAKIENGWTYFPNIGKYGADYGLRAATARQGLGANLPADAIYPTVLDTADTDGAPRRFRLHFPPGLLPPVGAFWSLTAYDADSHLVDNPAHIYAVGHQTPVAPGDDGTVVIAVQHDNPGAGTPDGNWLPIPPAGRFSLSLRLYAPKPEALDGTWQPPVLELMS